MVNEERVKLMTRMASYEAGEGRKNMAVGHYFRSDYISIQVLKAFISVTVCFALGLALYIYYNFENFMADIYEMDIIEFAKSIGIKYLWVAGIYIVVIYVISNIKYAGARKNLKKYNNNLKKLGRLYKE